MNPMEGTSFDKTVKALESNAFDSFYPDPQDSSLLQNTTSLPLHSTSELSPTFVSGGPLHDVDLKEWPFTDEHQNCALCQEDVTNQCRVICAECDNVTLCVNCFCKGAEGTPAKAEETQNGAETICHFNFHSYIPIVQNTFPLYKKDWSADEELLLIDGVGRFGFGNWNEVAELVNTVALRCKTNYQCEKHYFNVYLNGPTTPLPDPTTLLMSASGGPIPLGEEFTIQEEKPDYNYPKITPSVKPAPNKPSHQIIGYWPLRGDFDVEYENDAELILADMEFKHDDTPQEKQLKLQVIEIYNSKLDERIYRKNTIIERGLLDIKAVQQKEKKRTREERELHTLFKPLARLHTPEEHERFVQLLIEEKRIRVRLRKLQEWKSLGLRRIDEVRMYEEEKRRRTDLCNQKIAFPFIFDGNQKGQRRPRGSHRNDESVSTEDKASCDKGKTTSNQMASITDYPGSDILDEKERVFCEKVSLPPIFYLLAKRILLHEVASNGYFDREDFTKMMRIDVNKAGQLYDFFLNLEFTPIKSPVKP